MKTEEEIREELDNLRERANRSEDYDDLLVARELTLEWVLS